jgi:esterase/lipase superfamily enzyme
MEAGVFCHGMRLSITITVLALACSGAALQAQVEPITVTVAGQVLDAARRPLAGATVDILDDETVLASARTDEAGRYRVTLPIRPGEYRAVANRTTTAPAEAPVRVLPWAEGETLSVDLAIPPLTRGRPAPPAAKAGYSTVRIFYATDRQRTGEVAPATFYNGERDAGGRVELGTCDVSIPNDHRLAQLESPSITRFEFTRDPNRHVVLLRVVPEQADGYFTQLRARVGSSKRREAFVFVHGFLVSFEDAARTTAQLAADLQFDGAPILYSWPAGSRFYNYGAAEASAEWATGHFTAFLNQVVERTGAESIHVIAHSMGNRLVAGALNEIAAATPARLPLFNQVVLTAADIDTDVFRRLAARVAAAGTRVTMYVSSNDMALRASTKFHSAPRAGFAGPDLQALPGIETVDVSAVDSSLIGHFYYGESRSVVTDLYWLFRNWVPASARQHLTAVRSATGTLWRLLPGQP